MITDTRFLLIFSDFADKKHELGSRLKHIWLAQIVHLTRISVITAKKYNICRFSLHNMAIVVWYYFDLRSRYPHDHSNEDSCLYLQIIRKLLNKKQFSLNESW